MPTLHRASSLEEQVLKLSELLAHQCQENLSLTGKLEAAAAVNARLVRQIRGYTTLERGVGPRKAVLLVHSEGLEGHSISLSTGSCRCSECAYAISRTVQLMATHTASPIIQRSYSCPSLTQQITLSHSRSHQFECEITAQGMDRLASQGLHSACSPHPDLDQLVCASGCSLVSQLAYASTTQPVLKETRTPSETSSRCQAPMPVISLGQGTLCPISATDQRGTVGAAPTTSTIESAVSSSTGNVGHLQGMSPHFCADQVGTCTVQKINHCSQ